jgi:cell division protease FtsH
LNTANGPGSKKIDPRRNPKRNIGFYALIALVAIAIALIVSGLAKGDKPSEISFTKMTAEFKAVNVVEAQFEGTTLTATLKNDKKVLTYLTGYSGDFNYLFDTYIAPQVESGKLDFKNPAPKGGNFLVTLIPTLLMVGVLIFFMYWMMNSGAGGGGKVMQFGKSRARLQKDENKSKVTFADVAGLDEEKEELEEVVDFLKNPKKYNELGARIPKGILLVGPPGTGKTYISKAAAGEAGVPFFTISGSDFVEMFVGVGASRVRDLFEQAKKNSPCIIFIDEIDAVGRKRGAGLGGGHDEREQTLNQLLVEMDGFADNTGIIILAATNRPDILDSALLRPGRFDRQVLIGIPDIKGREAIFRIHSKNKPLEETVDPKVLARRTPGFTPADIENMLNEAALLAARRNGRKIRMDELEEAITKVIAGPEKKSRVITEDERRLTAFHEAGHAIVTRNLPSLDPVHQITIIPRGRAGGFTMTLPQEEKYYGTKTQMQDEIVDLLGGRAAEKLVLDDISTGASNDIQRATDIARDMVTKYGFSEKLGLVNYADADEVFLGKDFTTHKNYSEETASEIDEEIKTLIDEAFVKAEEILKKDLDKLTTVAEALLEVETLDGEQFAALYDGTLGLKELTEQIENENARISGLNEIEAQETERILEEAAKEAEVEEEQQPKGELIPGGYVDLREAKLEEQERANGTNTEDDEAANDYAAEDDSGLDGGDATDNLDETDEEEEK